MAKPQVKPEVILTAAQQTELALLATIGCTDEEISASLEHSWADLNTQYGDLIQKARRKTKAQLRKIQWKMAQDGNTDALQILEEQFNVQDESWKELLKTLRPKQRVFVCEYLKDSNATRAAIAAGYSKKTAKEIGHENLTKPHISRVLDSARKNIAEDAKISREWILEKLRDIVLKCIKTGGTFNPAAANKALELLGKEHKMFIDRRLLGVRNLDDMSEEELLEFLGGEPEPEELGKAASLHAPGHA